MQSKIALLSVPALLTTSVVAAESTSTASRGELWETAMNQATALYDVLERKGVFSGGKGALNDVV